MPDSDVIDTGAAISDAVREAAARMGLQQPTPSKVRVKAKRHPPILLHSGVCAYFRMDIVFPLPLQYPHRHDTAWLLELMVSAARHIDCDLGWRNTTCYRVVKV